MGKKKKEKIVIKIGTSSLVDKNGKISKNKIKKITYFVSEVQQRYLVILVSSGAIGFGRSVMKDFSEKSVVQKQALASIGQVSLISEYQKYFSKDNIIVSQILVIKKDFENKVTLKNLKNTIQKLLSNDIIPIFNENDSLMPDEIIFGDNDALAGFCAKYFKAKRLILISDINGLYDKDPNVNKNAKLISQMKKINNNFIKQHKTKGKFGTGGIYTKLITAKFLLKNNIQTFLCSNDLKDCKNFLLKNKQTGGTLFS